MSGSISGFFEDVGNALEDAVDDVATEVGDVAGDVRNEVNDGGNAAPAQPTPAQPTATQQTITQTVTQQNVAQPTPPAGGSDSPVARLYEAAFDRAPDDAGLAFWTNAVRGGAGLPTVADLFVASPEFQSRYGQPSAGRFVDQLYLNTLDREADPAGRAFWTAALDRGVVDRGDVLLAFSQTAEFASRSGTSTDDPLV